MRLSFIKIGPSAMLNVFEIVGNTEADRQTPMFGRGRIDHSGPANRAEASDVVHSDQALERRTICFSCSIKMHDIVIGLNVNYYELGCRGATTNSISTTCPLHKSG